MNNDTNELKDNIGKYALVTGGTSGIGFELARLLAADGYNLILVARNEQELTETGTRLSAEFKVQVITLAHDLFSQQEAFAVYEDIKAQGVHISILVNDAGQGVYGEFAENDLQRELDIIQLNVASVVTLTKLFLKDMLKKGDGKILNLASIAGKMPGPLQAVYHGTKAFVHSFTIAVGEEVKDTGVTLTSLLPGATDTDFFYKADMEEAKIVQEGKLGDAAEVAKDGYDALMEGKPMIVSGFKNKMQVAMSNVMPDRKVAENMHEQQKPVE